MLSSLSDGQRLVGIKQCTKAVNDGVVLTAYVAEGVAPNISEPFLRLCEKKQVPVIRVSTKKELGHLCQIDVDASVAVVLK
ncbi:MAG: ribosomal L7Ae/L30e/S12e/Gadd45 family protein [Clostridia bacterium]|nr:ribosomal L7Ae/L30e/S12e/Gadd45 family protein [Clostridia bacterium]